MMRSRHAQIVGVVVKNYSAGEITGQLQNRESVPLMGGVEPEALFLPPSPAALVTDATEGKA
jgi:hypothetical protein